MVPLELNAAFNLEVPITNTDHSTPTQSPDGLSIPPSIDFEEMAGPQLNSFHLKHASKLQEVSEAEKQECMILLSGLENAREEYHITTVLRDEHSSKTPFLVELNSSNDAKQQACDHHPLEKSCADIGGLRTLNIKFEVFASLLNSSQFFIAIPALLWETMNDYCTISNISAQLCRCVFEHESAFNTVTHASLLNFDYEQMSLPLAGWFEDIQRSVTQVLYENELQNFLLNFLNSLKCFASAETVSVSKGLTRGLGSCHSVLALQMGLYMILHISSSATVKPFVLFDFVLALPNHDTSSSPLFSATYVKKTGESQGFQVDVVHPRNMSTIYQNPCVKFNTQQVLNLVPNISHACHQDNHFARKMGIGLQNCAQNCDGERTSTNKLVGELEVLGTTTKGQQVHVIAIFIINQPLPIKLIFPLRFNTAMIFLLLPDAHFILLCGIAHTPFDRVVLPSGFWSAQVFKDINMLESHSTMIIAFVPNVVFDHKMKLQVSPILQDLGLQKHRHVRDYFFKTYIVLALFFLPATMLIKDVNGGKFYLIEVTVIHVVFLCHPRTFSVGLIDSLQVNSKLSPIRYLYVPLVLLPTIDIQAVVHIIFQDGLLMILEAEQGINRNILLFNPSFFVLMSRWFLAMLFGDTSTNFEPLGILPINKLVTFKYKEEALDAIYPVAIFSVAFVLFLQLQVVGSFRPYQIVELLSHHMTNQGTLATFWLWLLTTLSGFKVWLINFHGLIVVWAPVVIGNTFFTRELKFDHEFHISLIGATAIRPVFHFCEDLPIINSDLRMEYSILRNTNDDSHLIYTALWCLPPFTCAIPNDVVWSRYWLLDYTSTWDLKIMDDEATLPSLTVICNVMTQQSKIDEHMVQNYLGAIYQWGCSTYKIETQMMLPVIRVICPEGVLVISILLYKPIVNIESMKTFVFPVPAFFVLHRCYDSGKEAILIYLVRVSCFEELVQDVSITHALCDDHDGGARATSGSNQMAQVLLFLTPREGNHDMLTTEMTERRMVSAKIFWAHFPIPTSLRHEDMPLLKGGGLVRTISLDT